MTIHLELSPDTEKAYLAEAEARGVTLTVILQEALEIGKSMLRQPAGYQRLPHDEWLKKLDEWAQSHADLDLPPLSQVDMSREAIYGDRS